MPSSCLKKMIRFFSVEAIYNGCQLCVACDARWLDQAFCRRLKGKKSNDSRHKTSSLLKTPSCSLVVQRPTTIPKIVPPLINLPIVGVKCNSWIVFDQTFLMFCTNARWQSIRSVRRDRYLGFFSPSNNNICSLSIFSLSSLIDTA